MVRTTSEVTRFISRAAFGIVLAVSVACVASRAVSTSNWASYKQTWEVGWSDDWTLISAEETSVDHFLPGYLLTWEKTELDKRVVRRDAFLQHREFYWAHEELFKNGRLVARGHVIITPQGVPLFRIAALLNESLSIDSEERSISHYELHLLEADVRDCVYRSQSNFNGTGRGFFRGLFRVPDDTTLQSGDNCPTVEHLQTNPYQSRLPAT